MGNCRGGQLRVDRGVSEIRGREINPRGPASEACGNICSAFRGQHKSDLPEFFKIKSHGKNGLVDLPLTEIPSVETQLCVQIQPAAVEAQKTAAVVEEKLVSRAEVEQPRSEEAIMPSACVCANVPAEDRVSTSQVESKVPSKAAVGMDHCSHCVELSVERPISLCQNIGIPERIFVDSSPFVDISPVEQKMVAKIELGGDASGSEFDLGIISTDRAIELSLVEHFEDRSGPQTPDAEKGIQLDSPPASEHSMEGKFVARSEISAKQQKSHRIFELLDYKVQGILDRRQWVEYRL